MFETLKKMFGMEPIVMLDVDGVLNPLGDPNTRNPHTRVEGEYGVWFLNKDDGEWLRSFQESGATLLWQTTWEEEAVKYINPFYGIEDVDFISYPVLPEDSDGLTYKLPKIEEHAGKHPLVIIDDDVRDDLREWASQREQPTLVIEINGEIGWTKQDKEKVLSFLEAHKSKF